MVFCGIDIGTTSTKGIVLDERGRVVDEATLPTPMASARIYWYEHFCRTMQLFAERGQFADRSVACSVTGQGGSFVLLDAQYRPVGNVCCWTELAEDTIVQDLADAFGQTNITT
jgi:sugar (pentulose or hexulose) kinase